MAEWAEAPELEELARKIIGKRDEVSHVDADNILFLIESEVKPKAYATTYAFGSDPIGFFTKKGYAIVFWWQNCDCMSQEQLALLMFHELLHIPLLEVPGKAKLVPHNVQDFSEVLRLLGVDPGWAENGYAVPDILG